MKDGPNIINVIDHVGCRQLTTEELHKHYWEQCGLHEPTPETLREFEVSRENYQNVIDTMRPILILRERKVCVILVYMNPRGPGFSLVSTHYYISTHPEARFRAIHKLNNAFPCNGTKRRNVADLIGAGLRSHQADIAHSTFGKSVLLNVLQAASHTTSYWIAAVPPSDSPSPIIYGSLDEDKYWPLKSWLAAQESNHNAPFNHIANAAASQDLRGWLIDSHMYIADGRHPEDPNRFSS